MHQYFASEPGVVNHLFQRFMLDRRILRRRKKLNYKQIEF